MEEADAAAVSRALSGDRDAFRVLVERHSRNVFRLAFRMTGNEQDAEDVVQVTFMRAWRSLASFGSQAGFGTWLHRIAANYSLDIIRQRKRRDGKREVSYPDGADILESIRELEYYRRAVFTSNPGPTTEQVQTISAEVIEGFAQHL